ncbi:MAG: mechanosensitive ion channel family protein [Chloroflexi bacterium]|nr:mechanosensitive ion channel family protein [Chloroflexota bacterium]
MLELPNLPASVSIALQLALIAGTGLLAFMVVRATVSVSVRRLLEGRTEELVDGVLPPAELERRIQTIGRLVVRIAGALIVTVAVLMGLRLFGIDIGPAVAGLGVLGIAVGLGAQTIVRDGLAGIFIVLENQYSQGDIIRVADVEGLVEDFSLRRTTLRDLDGTTHTVPNGQIIVTSNLTRVWTRVHVDVTVASNTDLDRARELVDSVGASLRVEAAWGTRLLDPPQVVQVETLDDGSITVTALARIRAADDEAVMVELRKRIEASFAQAGIEIPHPLEGKRASDPDAP